MTMPPDACDIPERRSVFAPIALLLLCTSCAASLAAALAAFGFVAVPVFFGVELTHVLVGVAAIAALGWWLTIPHRVAGER